jgi:hypothetical protein
LISPTSKASAPSLSTIRYLPSWLEIIVMKRKKAPQIGAPFISFVSGAVFTLRPFPVAEPSSEQSPSEQLEQPLMLRVSLQRLADTERLLAQG